MTTALATTATTTLLSSFTSTRNAPHHHLINYPGTDIIGSERYQRTTRSRAPLTTIDPAMSQARGRLANANANGGRRASARLGGKEVEDVNGNGNANGVGGRAGKRKAVDYDEDIEGFQFSRATAPKKSKPATIDENTAPMQMTDDITQNQQPRKQKGKGRPPKTTEGPRAVSFETPNGKLPTRPQRRTSKRPAEDEPAAITATQKSSRSRRKSDDAEPAPIVVPKKRGASKAKQAEVSQTWQEEEQGVETPVANTQKIALPFADTPVIRRNKEMRKEKSQKGQRRSSLGLRGRRASSLIESGASNALPHDQVDTAQFYKHIEGDGLSEPRRMRQLLTWCATRALSAKPSGSRSGDESARLAARVIQEELLKDFANRSELSDWFSREETGPPAVVVKKPNPKNIQNEEKIKELEEQIHKLQLERQSLTSLLRPPSIPKIGPPAPASEKSSNPPNDTSTTPTPIIEDETEEDEDPINPSLLDPSQQSLLAALTNTSISTSTPTSKPPTTDPSTSTPTTSPTSISSITARLSRLTTSLMPTLDSFAAGVHDIELFRHAADDVAGQVLAICAKRLEERDELSRRRRMAEEQGSSTRKRGKEKASAEGGKSEEGDSDEVEGVDVGGRGVTGEKEDLAVVLAALSRVERRG
ncbi:hypothetical protein FQN55_006233 [Onygenales sp. PD_40]|nr:hypothetical protein FQN55_006233 [Onygenales sp. PD_40]